jgi:hypothetical protein
MLYNFSGPRDKVYDKAIVFCFSKGAAFGFTVVPITELPQHQEDNFMESMHSMGLDSDLRINEFRHQFSKDNQKHRYALFALCEQGMLLTTVYSKCFIYLHDLAFNL